MSNENTIYRLLNEVFVKQGVPLQIFLMSIEHSSHCNEPKNKIQRMPYLNSQNS